MIVTVMVTGDEDNDCGSDGDVSDGDVDGGDGLTTNHVSL